MRVLIIDPDALGAHILAVAARRRGHETFEVSSLREADDALPFEPMGCVYSVESLTPESAHDLVAFASRARRMVTVAAASDIQDRTGLTALRAGVGDVVRKPYDPFELVERIERLVELQDPVGHSELCVLGDLVVDLSRYSARKNGRDLRLTKLELRLLFCLMVNADRLAPTDRLLTFGWDDLEPPEPALLKTHISHLRGKLRDAGGDPVDITARHSLGYSIALRGAELAAEA